jgi:hypothetical protein
MALKRDGRGGNRSARLTGGKTLHVGRDLERRIRADVDVLCHCSVSLKVKGDAVTARIQMQALECTVELVRQASVVPIHVHFRVLGSDVCPNARLRSDGIRVAVVRRVSYLPKCGTE